MHIIIPDELIENGRIQDAACALIDAITDVENEKGKTDKLDDINEFTDKIISEVLYGADLTCEQAYHVGALLSDIIEYANVGTRNLLTMGDHIDKLMACE